MIDFACQKIDLNDVVKCGLGLTKSDLFIFNFMRNNSTEWFSTEDIAKKVKLNLSTVQRAVKKLREAEVLILKQQNLENGGYIFLYQAENKNKIRKVILKIAESWIKKVEAELKTF